jgi:hypothetical protein
MVEIVILSAWKQWQVTAAAVAIQPMAQLAAQIWRRNPAMANLAAILEKAVVQAVKPTAVLLPVLAQAAIMAPAALEALTIQRAELVLAQTVVDTAVLMGGALAAVLAHLVIMDTQEITVGQVPADNTIRATAMAAAARAVPAMAAITTHMAALQDRLVNIVAAVLA